mgnify:CR=1 FL=1
MGQVQSPLTKEMVGEALRTNLIYFLGGLGKARSRTSELSPFEQAVVAELLKKKSDGSLALLNVPVDYHPRFCSLRASDGTSTPHPSYARGALLVRVEDCFPDVTTLAPAPDEIRAQRVFEESLRMYRSYVRRLPQR